MLTWPAANGARPQVPGHRQQEPAGQPAEKRSWEEIYQEWRKKAAGLTVSEQIASLRELMGWTPKPSVVAARVCFKQGADKCPSAWVVASPDQVQEAAGGDLLAPADPTLRLYDAQRLLFHPDAPPPAHVFARAALTYYREGYQPAVVRLIVGPADVARKSEPYNHRTGENVSLDDGTQALYSEMPFRISGPPFYPWQEVLRSLDFYKGGVFYHFEAAGLSKGELWVLASSMQPLAGGWQVFEGTGETFTFQLADVSPRTWAFRRSGSTRRSPWTGRALDPVTP